MKYTITQFKIDQIISVFQYLREIKLELYLSKNYI